MSGRIRPPSWRLPLHWGWILAGALAGCSDSTAPEEATAPWIQVDVGTAHACGLDEEGRVFCWGDNSFGQAGSRGAVGTLVPTAVETELRFGQIAAGGVSTCGVAVDGRLYCWGSNTLGQLGDGGILSSSQPVEVAGGKSWTEVSVGTYHVCALDDLRALHCWGGDRWDVALGYRAPGTCDGPLFEPRWPCSGVPMAVQAAGGAYDWVQAGLYQTCVGTGASGAACWGTNDTGQLGADTEESCSGNDPVHPSSRPCSRTPLAPSGPALSSVSPGTTHGCGLDPAGVAYCWGGLILNFGQVGSGDLEGSEAPVPVSGIGSLQSISTSASGHIRTFSCGIDGGGSVSCWGANRFGQLGSDVSTTCDPGGVPCSMVPKPIASERTFRNVSLGTEFACGLTTDGGVLCWGFNEQGQLGDGTLVSRGMPAEVER